MGVASGATYHDVEGGAQVEYMTPLSLSEEGGVAQSMPISGRRRTFVVHNVCFTIPGQTKPCQAIPESLHEGTGHQDARK